MVTVIIQSQVHVHKTYATHHVAHLHKTYATDHVRNIKIRGKTSTKNY